MASGKRLDDRTRNRLILMSQQGVEQRTAASACGVCPSTVSRIYKIAVDKRSQKS